MYIYINPYKIVLYTRYVILPQLQMGRGLYPIESVKTYML